MKTKFSSFSDISNAKPNFFVIGAQHCATTSLCYLLGQHQDVLLCRDKEPHFFSKEEVYKRGWGWYSSLFSHYTGENAIGEGSTTYSMSLNNPKTSMRIAKNIPEANIIYVVRNPIKRIESAYKHRLLAQRKCWDFASTIKKVPGIIDNSLYWKQISCYRDYFSDEQIKILFFEDFVSQSKLILKKCFEFLGVNPNISINFSRVRLNQSNGKLYYNFAGRLLKKIFLPLFEANSDLLKNKIKNISSKIFMNSIADGPRLERDSLAWVRDAVYEDSIKILSYGGKDENYWDFNIH